MALSGDSAPWLNLRLEELVRLLHIHNEASERRREKFQDKLAKLKERQELLQQRRVARLRNQGISIDIENVRRRAGNTDCAKTSNWIGKSDVGEQHEISGVNDRIKEMLKRQDSEIELDVQSIYEEEAELECEDDQQEDQKSSSSIGRQKSQSRSQLMSREATTLSLIKENEVLRVAKSVKSVGIKVKSRGEKQTKKSWKRAGTVVATAKFMSKMPKKKGSTSSKTK